jgi:ABC-type antimicrobial peptide transport system permease subunit
MLKKYLKMTIRKLTRNKVYSIINILGLSIGIASSILILLWVTHELSYDRFHKNADEIYRVVGDDGLIGKISTTCGPLSDYLKNNFPGIVNSTRYMPYAGSPFKYNNNLFKVDKGAFADPAFFEMFSYGFIHGDSRSALSNVSSIVITERMAKRFFKNENPMGKTLLIDGRSPLIVSAVIKNPPANSQLQFDFLLSTMILKYIGYPLDDWSSSGIYTFVETQKNTVIQKLNAQIADLMPKHIPGFNRKLFLQPLTGIHLTNDFAYDLPGIGDKKYVFIFSAIALFLILIACINYINLSTARVLKISKEVGLRKIMGANRFQMIQQFFSESMTIVIISFVLAIVLVEIILPAFNQLSGKALTINYFAVAFFYIIAVLPILVSFISGGYPALYLSSVNPVNALKNIFSGRKKGSLFRKVLVVTQFSLSIILIIGTMIVYQQLNYIKN